MPPNVCKLVICKEVLAKNSLHRYRRWPWKNRSARTRRTTSLASRSATPRTAFSTPARCGRSRTRCACRSTTSSASTGRRRRARWPRSSGSRPARPATTCARWPSTTSSRSAPTGGPGRERWWERPIGGVSFANAEAMKTPAGRAATQIVMNEFFRNRQEQLMDVHERRASRSADETWQSGTLISTATARLTPEQSKELSHQDHGADRRRRGQLPQSDRRGRATRDHPGRPVPAPRPGRTVMTAISASAHVTPARRRSSARCCARHPPSTASSPAASSARCERRVSTRRRRAAAPPAPATPPRRAARSACFRDDRRDRPIATARRTDGTEPRPGGRARTRSAATSASSGRPRRSATSPTAWAARGPAHRDDADPRSARDLGDRGARVPAVARLRAAGRHARRPVRPPHHHGVRPTASAARSRCGSRSSP